MARDHPRARRSKALELKKTGNELMTVVGGREVHPINVRVGGFYRAPRKRELAPLVEQLERAREIALETVRWTAGFDFPDFEQRLRARRAVASRASTRSTAGRIVSNRGLDIDVAEYDEHFVEEHVAALERAALAAARARLLPRAGRWRASRSHFDRLSPLAREAARRGRARAGRAQPVPEHRRALRSSSSTPPTRRCG